MLLLQKLSDLPLEMMESVLTRTFLLLYQSDLMEADADRVQFMPGSSINAEKRAFTMLVSVCWYWHQSVTGWSRSPTTRRQLKKLIERE